MKQKPYEVNDTLRQSRNAGRDTDYLIVNIIPTKKGNVYILREIQAKPRVKALKKSSLCDYKIVD